MTGPLKNILEGINQTVTSKYSGTSYTDSYVAFLDILGMKNLVNNEDCEYLRKMFNSVEGSEELYKKISLPSGDKFLSKDHVKMTIMSDTIVLSISSSVDLAFSKLAGFSSYLIHKFLTTLEKPVFIRGAITKGEIFQDNNVVFGPALVDAYCLESQTAINMRCIISNSLSTDSTFIEYLATTTHALHKDHEDGMYFIDFATKDNYKLLLKATNAALNSKMNDDIKNKYKWLNNYITREVNA